MSFIYARRSCVLLIVSLVLAGCANTRPDTILPPEAVVNPGVQESLSQHVSSSGLSFDTYNHAQVWALLNAPRLVALLADIELADAERWQQSLLRNPAFAIGLTEPESGGRWQLHLELGISLADWLGRRYRSSAADANFQKQYFESLDAINTYLLDVQVAWLQAVGDQQRASVTQQLNLAAATAADMARLLFDAGNISELDYLGHAAIAAETRVTLLDAEFHAEKSLNHLKGILGLSQDTEIDLPDSVPPLPEQPQYADADASGLLALAESAYPAFVLESLENDRYTRALDDWRVRRRLLASTFELSAERESDGEIRRGLGLGLELPIFDNGQAQKTVLEARHTRNTAAYSARRQETAAILASDIADLRKSSTSLIQLQQDDLPRFIRMLDLALREYNFMLRGSFDLIEVRERYLQARYQEIALLEDFWKAQARIENLLGSHINAAFYDEVLTHD